MARKKTPPKDTTGEIPAWFMTYSDVITLLMTFFILLLTFASQEPEKFEQMKVSMFGGGGGDGIAGIRNGAMDRQSVALRFRPDRSRLTLHGTETPPLNSDSGSDGLNEGLKALEQESEFSSKKRLTFTANRNSILTKDGKLTPTGESQLSEMATQIRRFSMKLAIRIAVSDDLPEAVQLAHDMTYQHGVPLGQVSVSMQQVPVGNTIEFTMTRSR